MNLAQLRLFAAGLAGASGVEADLSQQIANAINQLDKEVWLQFMIGDFTGFRLYVAAGALIGVEGYFDIIFNWRSWETSIMWGVGGSIGLTLSAGVGVGIVAGNGAPNNEAFWGWSYGVNITAIAIGGLNWESSFALEGDAQLHSLKAMGGPAGLSLERSLGLSYTWEIARYMGNPNGNLGYWIQNPKQYYDQGYNALSCFPN